MDVTMRRHLMGIGALGLIVGGALLAWYSDSETGRHMAGMALVRVGVLLSLLWLALPQVLVLAARVSTPMSIALLAGLVIFAIYPRAFPVVAVLIGGVAVLEFFRWLKSPFEK